MRQLRLDRLHQTMAQNQLDVIALMPGPNLFYLTSLSFHLMERPIIALYVRDEPPCLILPELERIKAESADMQAMLIPFGEEVESRNRAFQEASERCGLDGLRIGVEPLRMRYQELELMRAVAPAAEIVSAEPALGSFRLLKDEIEVVAMRQAVHVAQEALKATLQQVQMGMTEQDLASELVLQLLQAGSNPKIPFEPIVASGPNSALPHATPTDRKLKLGDLLLIDWGATVEGYVSDLTRTFALGKVDPELVRIHEIVAQANQAGRAAVVPGATCGEVDIAARRVIDEAGYGQYFIHRTGHGIGLEGHEAPYIRGDNPLPLVRGMTFTVEPGIYLPELGGVRVEDNVVVTSLGMECLSDYPRELEVIA